MTPDFENFGHTNPIEDDAALEELMGACYDRSRTAAAPIAVEVGCWMGGTTRLLADQGFHVFTVDHWKGSEDSEDPLNLKIQAAAIGQVKLFQTFCANMGGYLFRSVFPLIGNSTTIASVWPAELKIHFLFIDGDHSYEGCLSDIQNWTPHVAKGGIIAIHDFGVFAGVNRAVIETGPFERAGRTVAWRKCND